MLTLPESDTAERERILLAEALAGHTTVDWLDYPDGVRLGLVRWSDGVAYGVSCRLNQWLADLHGSRLPTAWRADWCWRHAAVQLDPIIRPAAVIGLTSTMREVSAQHAKRDPGFGDSKCWVLDAKCWLPGLRACNHGYFVPPDEVHGAEAKAWHGIHVYYRAPIDAYVIQDRGAAHDIGHADCSQWPWIVVAPDSDYADLSGDRHPAVPPLAARVGEGITITTTSTTDGAARPGMPPLPAGWHQADAALVLRLGTVGEPVRRWQRVLVDSDHAVAVDGHYGPRTEAATRLYQHEHELTTDGIVGPLTWAASRVPPPPDTVPAPPPSSVATAVGGPTVAPVAPVASIIDRIRLVQAHPTNYRRGRPGPVDLIMMHTAECAESITAAEQLGAWCQRDGSIGVSWHFAVDSDSIVQCVREEDSAWACPAFNGRAIHLELAGYARQGKSGWADDYSVAVLANAVELVRWILSRRPNIPAVRLGWSDLLGEAPGICGHGDGSRALREAQALGLRREPWYDLRRQRWRTSTHTDPGPDWPWHEFMQAIRA